MDKLGEYIVQSLQRHPEHLLLKIKREYFYSGYTYAQSLELIRTLITYFKSKKLDKGSKVLFWAPNMPEWTLAYLACILEGIVVVPASVQSSTDLIGKYLSWIKPDLILKSTFLPSLVGTDIEVVNIEHIFDYARNLDEAEFRTDLKGDDLLEIMFTSGTTGEPKGVMLNRKNFITEVETLQQAISIKKHSRMLSILPYSHIYEQIVSLIYPLKYGVTIFYVSRLTSSVISTSLNEYKVTHLVLVPEALKTFTNRIIYKFKRFKMGWLFGLMLRISVYLPRFGRRILFSPILKQFGGKLEMVTLGGAKIDKRVQRIWSLFGVDIIEGYGLTETTAVVTMNTPENNVIGSSGKPIPGIDIKFTDEGEVLIKGDVVFSGYYERDDLNKQVFDSEGYFKTGDIGAFDENGNLVLKGRQKFRIVLSTGEKVYPEDIEYQLRQIKGIKDAVVFPYLENKTVFVAATIIPDRPNSDIDRLIERANQKLEVSQKISYQVEWPEEDFPRTPTLKVIRKRIEEKAREIIEKGIIETFTKDDKGSPIELTKTRDIVAFVCSLPLNRVKKNSVLGRDLKIDSLKRLSIITLLEEEFSTEIDENQIDANTTFEDLCELVKASPKVNKHNIELAGWQFGWFIKLIRVIALRLLIFPGLRLVTNVKVINADKLRQKQAIYIANHPGPYDLLTIMSALNNRELRNTFLVASSQFWKGIDRIKYGFLEEIFAGAIPVDKSGSHIKETFEKIGTLLDKGMSMLIVPMGENTLNDDDIRQVRDGAAFIAKATDIPIVPCYIEQTWSKIFTPDTPTKYIPNFSADRDVSVAVGDSFKVESFTNDDAAKKMIWESILGLKEKYQLR
ncbi:MAG: AMP-binding protein [Candidatus Dojkabacteria bacterium]